MINLKNKSIILTGATGGIGYSMVETLIAQGANLLVTGTNEKKLEELKTKYKNLIILKQDISNHDQLEDFIEKCNSLLGEKIDVLINNAGIAHKRIVDQQWLVLPPMNYLG